MLQLCKDKTECELKRILLTASRVAPTTRQQDLRRLCRSLHNLRLVMSKMICCCRCGRMTITDLVLFFLFLSD